MYFLCFTVSKYSSVYVLFYNLKPCAILHSPSVFHVLFIAVHFFFRVIIFLFLAHFLFVYSPSAIHFLRAKTKTSMRRKEIRRSDESRDNDDHASRFFTLSLVPKAGMPDTVNYQHEQCMQKMLFLQ